MTEGPCGVEGPAAERGAVIRAGRPFAGGRDPDDMNVRISPTRVRGSVRAPPSKSYTHRAVLAAGYADGATVRNPLFSADTAATARAVEAYGGSAERVEGPVGDRRLRRRSRDARRRHRLRQQRHDDAIDDRHRRAGRRTRRVDRRRFPPVAAPGAASRFARTARRPRRLDARERTGSARRRRGHVRRTGFDPGRRVLPVHHGPVDGRRGHRRRDRDRTDDGA